MNNTNFPKQAISYRQKDFKWRKSCVDWGANNTVMNSSLIRKTVAHKKLNYDLLSGKLNMNDLESIMNPAHIDDGKPMYKIQHYPIMNVKLDLLRGEEEAAPFDFKVVVTNPNAISEIEENKKAQISQYYQQLIESTSLSDEEYQKRLQKMSDYFQYDWQDMREIRANELLNHYWKELNIPMIFNEGFMDVLTVKEEIYKCSIVSNEPVLERLNPCKLHVYLSGYSKKIEDADIITYEDYWQPGKIYDTFYDSLTASDVKKLEKIISDRNSSSSDGRDDARNQFILPNEISGDSTFKTDADGSTWIQFADGVSSKSLPYDIYGNIRVLQVFWKSRRRIKKVTSIDQETKETTVNFYPENYEVNKDLGETAEIKYINEAWEGTMIGSGEDAIYINMRPCPIQYNRLSNPSKCHFGIIGTIYNTNDSKPYSMVDMMKPYNYLYDVIKDRLNRLLARNMGKLIKMDFSKIPDGWDIDKWLYYVKTSGLIVEDNFKEVKAGAAKGKLAGMMNTASNGVVDAELGNSIQQYINLLEYIKMEMSDIVGISKQREGQISNRETVGGVERATLQSSHITKWLFSQHEETKKRVLECFLETAKIAMKGNNKKFSYILSDGSQKIMEIDGDEFAEADYGLVVDASNKIEALDQKIETIAQAAMQNGVVSFSTVLDLFSSCSLAEKKRMLKKEEKAMKESQQQAQQQEVQLKQQEIQSKVATEQAKMELEDKMNQRDNETKLIIANMQAIANAQEPQEGGEEDKEKLMQDMKKFDETIKLDREKFEFDKHAKTEELRLKEKQINKQSQKPVNKSNK